MCTRVIDYLILYFSKIGIVEMSDEDGNTERRFLLEIIALLVKRYFLKDFSSFCFVSSALICSTFLLLYTIFILAYWLFLSNRPFFVSNSLIHVTSLTGKVSIIYLTSINNKVTIICFLEYQLISPLFNMKINPNVDFLIILLSTPSELE